MGKFEAPIDVGFEEVGVAEGAVRGLTVGVAEGTEVSGDDEEGLEVIGLAVLGIRVVGLAVVGLRVVGVAVGV